jgi:hypothetical protein
MRVLITWILGHEALRDVFKQGSALIQHPLPEATVRCFLPVTGGVGLVAPMNKPEQASCEDIAEFLVLGALGNGEWFVRLLANHAADRDLASHKMVDDAEPVLMIDGGEQSVEPLGVDKQRTARDEWYLLSACHAAGVPHY